MRPSTKSQVMSAKHTAGPWEIHSTNNGFTRIDANPRWYDFVRVVTELDGAPSLEGQANARLIAAAPDLLAALKEARHALSYIARHSDTADDVIDAADAAITKAEGAL